MGKGIAIDPEVGELVAPADGEITTIFPTGHAVGITTTDGAEILIHYRDGYSRIKWEWLLRS